MKFVFLLLSISLVAGCGSTRTDGGQASFDSAEFRSLDSANHATYAQTVIKREERDPEGITLKQLIASKRGPLRKLGLVLFETQFQSSRTGLAVGRNIYLSPRGKQILAERAYWFWTKKLRAAPGVTWVGREELEKSPAFRYYGSVVPDYILQQKLAMDDTDIFWKSGGQEIPMDSLILPANQQDVSIIYIPASEMMIIPKMVEHQKHWVNDICKEMGLDGVVLVNSVASWEQGSIDKRTKEVIPEEVKMTIEASVLYPFNAYQEAGAAKNKLNLPQKSVPLAVYTVKTKFPVKISVPEEEQTFATIQHNLLDPFWSNYTALSGLMIQRMITDIQQTLR